MPYRWRLFAYRGITQLFLLAVIISGFVAGAGYAGTSELFGAYLAGVIVAQVFHALLGFEQPSELSSSAEVSREEGSFNLPPNDMVIYTPHLAFTIFVRPILQYVLSPIFFASIGTALPIRSLGSVEGSSRLVWRGFVYALLMAVAKALTGVWLLVPPDFFKFKFQQFYCVTSKRKDCDQTAAHNSPDDAATQNPLITRINSGILLGLAMIARGEIALIVSQLARPILTERSEELYAIVIWAILLDTIGGALGVGLFLRRKIECAE